MAQGDAVISALSSINAAASLTIRPSDGATLLVKNLYYGGAVEVYITDGTNSIKVDSDGAAGQMLGVNFMISYARYITVKNVDATAKYLAYDAVQWS